MDRYLVDGEEILAQAGDLYASNRRLLRYKKSLKGEELDDIPYSHVASISVVRKTRKSLVKAGAIVTVIAIFALTTLIMIKPVLKSTSDLFGASVTNPAIQSLPFVGLDLQSLFAPLIPFSVFILVLGIFLFGTGLFLPQVFIQFHAPGLSGQAEARFRLGNVHDEATLNLVRIVRQQSLVTEPASLYARTPGKMSLDPASPETPNM